MSGYTINHTLKARLHNILADVYNHATQPSKFPTPPDTQEIYGLMAALNKAEEAQVDIFVRGGVAYIDKATSGIDVSIVDMDEEEELTP